MNSDKGDNASLTTRCSHETPELPRHDVRFCPATRRLGKTNLQLHFVLIRSGGNRCIQWVPFDVQQLTFPPAQFVGISYVVKQSKNTCTSSESETLYGQGILSPGLLDVHFFHETHDRRVVDVL